MEIPAKRSLRSGNQKGPYTEILVDCRCDNEKEMYRSGSTK